MRLFAIFILLPQILCSQTMTQIKGYEQTEHRYQGYVRKTERIFDGINMYNKTEETTWINPYAPPDYANCIVEAHYVWGRMTNGVLTQERHITFIVNQVIPLNHAITEVTNAPTNPWGPMLPDRRIATAYTVGSAGDSYWDYCRTTWRLANPTGMAHYYANTYQVYPGAVLVTSGFSVPARTTIDVVYRYEDLIRPTTGQHANTIDPDGPAWGPYQVLIVPTFQVNNPILGTSGSYYVPQIPSRKSIMDYLELDYFNSLSK